MLCQLRFIYLFINKKKMHNLVILGSKELDDNEGHMFHKAGTIRGDLDTECLELPRAASITSSDWSHCGW